MILTPLYLYHRKIKKNKIKKYANNNVNNSLPSRSSNRPSDSKNKKNKK